MWELIAANRRKSFMLAFGMAAVFLAIGAAAGVWLIPERPETGAVYGAFAALILWMALCLTSYYGGDSILLSSSRAHEVTPDVDPRLFNVVEEMKIAAGLPVMPRVYIIDEPEPNAFATGARAGKVSVAVTAGLLKRLNRDELQGVIAHEMSHIQNRDVLYMTFAAMMLGSIELLCQVFRHTSYASSSRRFRSDRKSSSGGAAIVIALVFMIVGPILARLFYFAISRRREYLADASGARLTRYPEGLASALEKISAGSGASPIYANEVTAPLFIVNPFAAPDRALSALGATHPPIEKRVAVLRAMGQGTGFASYEKAFRAMTGQGGLLPPSALSDPKEAPPRAASAPEAPQPEAAVRRGTGDLIRALNDFAFLLCTCGLKIKLPPGLRHAPLECPRCGNRLALPQAEMLAAIASAGGAGAGAGTAAAPAGGEATAVAKYRRLTTGWESFACRCGRVLQISPSFAAPAIQCPACGVKIGIEK